MNATERFSNRADDYAKWRPGYPEEVVDALELAPGALVADIGAGTGLASELFLRRGHGVIAVEPNAAMRTQAMQLLSGHARFRCVEGTAEATGLEDGSVDAVVCAQAFHWVDQARARGEFLRIVKPGGVIGVMWNLRAKEGSEFRRGLEELIQRHSADYRERISPATDRAVAGIARIFAPRRVEQRGFRHAQWLDWEGLVGRQRSASYVPLEGDPEHDAFFAALRALFERTNEGGRVSIEYECRLYWVRAD